MNVILIKDMLYAAYTRKPIETTIPRGNVVALSRDLLYNNLFSVCEVHQPSHWQFYIDDTTIDGLSDEGVSLLRTLNHEKKLAMINKRFEPVDINEFRIADLIAFSKVFMDS